MPYLKDTTPSWSTRGRLRNALMPLLEELYGAGAVGRNLTALARMSDEMGSLVQRTVYQPFME